MLSISHAFSTFNADACDARHILSLREDRNRILGSPLDTLHHSLVETGYQATKHGSIYPTESGRLLVVHHGQARGYDCLWLIGLCLLIAVIRRHYGQAYRHLLFLALSFTAAFCFYLYWDISCVHTSLRPLGDTILIGVGPP